MELFNGKRGAVRRGSVPAHASAAARHADVEPFETDAIPPDPAIGGVERLLVSGKGYFQTLHILLQQRLQVGIAWCGGGERIDHRLAFALQHRAAVRRQVLNTEVALVGIETSLCFCIDGRSGLHQPATRLFLIGSQPVDLITEPLNLGVAGGERGATGGDTDCVDVEAPPDRGEFVAYRLGRAAEYRACGSGGDHVFQRLAALQPGSTRSF